MAARALVTDDDDTVLDRLTTLAPSAHWRNTWLLAAGRIFTLREHLRDRIVTLLANIDTVNLLALLTAPGARLAIDILDDDIAAQAPRHQRMIAERALTLLDFAPDHATQRLADTLYDVCQADRTIRGMVDTALKRVLGAGGPAGVSAMTILARWEQGTGGIAANARQQLYLLVSRLSPRQQRTMAPLAAMYPDGPLRVLWGAADRNRKARTHTLANLVRPHLRADNLDPGTEKAVARLLDRLARVRFTPNAQKPLVYEVVYDDGIFDDGGALSDPGVHEVIVPAVEELATRNWQNGGALRGVLANWLARRPAGNHVWLGSASQAPPT